jgi:DNA-binding response OmpR family regulator
MLEERAETLIAIVEDEPSISEVVSLYLKRAGYHVQLYTDGLVAQAAFSHHMPDLIILDVMLPGMDGFALTRSLRDHSDVPILMLTARREESDRIAGLELGADDYVVKPFSPQELVSRVRAVLRRLARDEKNKTAAPVSFPSLSVNPQTRVVVARGGEIFLTAKEFDMLYFLVRHPRQVFTRDQLLENIWGLSEYIDPSTVTVHIRRLREKIEIDPANPACLQTVWGVGYKFEP